METSVNLNEIEKLVKEQALDYCDRITIFFNKIEEELQVSHYTGTQYDRKDDNLIELATFNALKPSDWVRESEEEGGYSLSPRQELERWINEDASGYEWLEDILNNCRRNLELNNINIVD